MRIKKTQLQKIIREEVSRLVLLSEWDDSAPPSAPTETSPPVEPTIEDGLKGMTIVPFISKAKKILKSSVTREWKGEVKPIEDDFINAIRSAWNKYTNSKVLPSANPDIKSVSDWAAAIANIIWTTLSAKELIALGFDAKVAARLVALGKVATAAEGAAAGVGVGMVAGHAALILYGLMAFLSGWIIGDTTVEAQKGFWRYRYWEILEKIIDQFPTETIDKFIQKESFDTNDDQKLLKIIREAVYPRMTELIYSQPVKGTVESITRSAWTGGKPAFPSILRKHIRDFIKILSGDLDGLGGTGLLGPMIKKIAIQTQIMP
jgi:hypothetical protein